MDNSVDRLHDVFFYGLYMDEEILLSKGVKPKNRRLGSVDKYKLRIGNMATLLRDENSKAYGIVYSLTHAQIDKLYKDSGLTMYESEALLVNLEDGEFIVALCCNLLKAPLADEKNDEYLEKLIKCMSKYGLPLPNK